MTAISRTRGKAVSPRSGYQYFRKNLSVMLRMLLITFLATIVNYIVHLPPIATAVGRDAVWLNILGSIVATFMYVFTILTIPLIVDKKHTPWDGLIASFLPVKSYWFKVFMPYSHYLCFFIVATISLIVGRMIYSHARLLGAGIFILILVWLLPYIFSIQGVLYHKLVD